ncbi:hypothetical protein ACSBR1_018192 [Camellia fascicularis]
MSFSVHGSIFWCSRRRGTTPIHPELDKLEINAVSHLLNLKWLGRGKVPFFEGTSGNRSSRDGVGPVARRIRARGYEPQCRGFESLLAHNRPKRKGPFPLGIGKS